MSLLSIVITALLTNRDIWQVSIKSVWTISMRINKENREHCFKRQTRCNADQDLSWVRRSLRSRMMVLFREISLRTNKRRFLGCKLLSRILSSHLLKDSQKYNRKKVLNLWFLNLWIFQSREKLLRRHKRFTRLHIRLLGGPYQDHHQEILKSLQNWAVMLKIKITRSTCKRWV